MKLMKLFPLRNWQFYVFHHNNNSIISIAQRKSLSNKYRELFLIKSRWAKHSGFGVISSHEVENVLKEKLRKCFELG